MQALSRMQKHPVNFNGLLHQSSVVLMVWKQALNTCAGFDVLLDARCKPHIIEINHNPSFKLPTPLDVEIKVAALTGCLALVCDR